IGGSRVGKSWLLYRCVHGWIYEYIDATIGVSSSVKEVNLEDGTRVKLNIWDTAGAERSDSVNLKLCDRAHAIIVVYDITEEHSFERAKNLG
ncbi:unnamed protein product, partial [Pocillopora meandrina]